MSKPVSVMFESVLRDEISDVLEDLGTNASTWLARSIRTIDTLLADVALTPNADVETLYRHGRARLEQLAAVHLVNAKERLRDKLLTTAFAVWRAILVATVPAAAPVVNLPAPGWVSGAIVRR